MPHLSFQCRAGQPIMPVLVAPSWKHIEKLRLAGQSAAEPILVDALIDTAADCSVIRQEIARRLGIDPVNRRRVRAPTTGAQADSRNVHAVSIVLAHPQRSYQFPSSVEVLESSLGHADCEMLLGRDVLCNCLFILDGAARFTSAF